MRAALIFFAAVIVGCGGNPLVGKWEPEFSEAMLAELSTRGLKPQMELEFKADGKFRYTIDSAGERHVLEGDYTVLDDVVDLVVTKADGEARPQIKRRASLSDSDTALTLQEMGVPIKFRKAKR
jgi:hypothetical protein